MIEDIPRAIGGTMIAICTIILISIPRRLWLGRLGFALLGAVLAVATQIISSSAAYDSISLPTLMLLTGTMILGYFLRDSGLFFRLKRLLQQSSGGSLVWRLALLTAVLSAIITNDAAAIILTPFVMELCTERNVSPVPFLLVTEKPQPHEIQVPTHPSLSLRLSAPVPT